MLKPELIIGYLPLRVDDKKEILLEGLLDGVMHFVSVNLQMGIRSFTTNIAGPLKPVTVLLYDVRKRFAT